MLDAAAFRLIHTKPSLYKVKRQVDMPKRLTEEETVELVYNIIKENKGILRSGIMEITNKSYAYISRRIAPLLEAGRIKYKLITCKGSNKTHTYEVVQG